MGIVPASLFKGTLDANLGSDEEKVDRIHLEPIYGGAVFGDHINYFLANLEMTRFTKISRFVQTIESRHMEDS